MQRTLQQRGFSLIELLVAIAIIGVLISLAIPAYQEYLEKARRTEAKTALLDLATRQERFFSTNNTYTSDSAALAYTTAFPIPVVSSSGSFYNLTVVASDATGFLAAAIPTGSQADDEECHTFRINHLGIQSNIDAAEAALAGDGCW